LFRRLDPPPRIITVGGDRRHVVLTVSHDPVGRTHLHGRLAPAGPTRVGLLSLATGAVRVTVVDRTGRFAFEAVDRGPAHLLIRPRIRAAVVL
jgi:hypothetical protein